VKIKGEMGWRLFVDSYEDKNRPETYVYDSKHHYKQRSGRTAEKHEELHSEYARDYAKQIDEIIHALADGKCLSTKCYAAKMSYHKSADKYYSNEKLYKDAQLDYEDYPQNELPLLGKLKEHFKDLMTKAKSEMDSAQRKILEDCK
jgi:hypothetical protein